MSRGRGNGLPSRGGRGGHIPQTTGVPQTSGGGGGGNGGGVPVPPIKRGAPGGPIGSKRGRYEPGPQNRQIPLHHGSINSQIPPQHVQSHNSYNNSQPPVQSK